LNPRGFGVTAQELGGKTSPWLEVWHCRRPAVKLAIAPMSPQMEPRWSSLSIVPHAHGPHGARSAGETSYHFFSAGHGRVNLIYFCLFAIWCWRNKEIPI
jgi:hypothetical protein